MDFTIATFRGPFMFTHDSTCEENLDYASFRLPLACGSLPDGQFEISPLVRSRSQSPFRMCLCRFLTIDFPYCVLSNFGTLCTSFNWLWVEKVGGCWLSVLIKFILVMNYGACH